jgi:hypothetical protein
MKVENEVMTNANWTKDDQENFWKIIKRKRDQLLPIRVKAAQLFKSNLFEEGIAVLNHFVLQFKEDPDLALKKNKYPGLYRGELMEITFVIAKKFLEKQKSEEAEHFIKIGEFINYYVSTVSRIQIELNRNKTHLSTKYKGYPLMADYYISEGNLSKAKEWLDIHFVCLPNFELFGYGIGYETYVKFGQITQDFSKPKFIRNICFQSFENYLIESNTDYKDIISGEVENDLEVIAENFYVGYYAVCPNLHLKNKQSLIEIDFAFANPNEVNGEKYDLESTPS